VLVVLALTRAVARLVALFAFGVARDGCATGVFAIFPTSGVTSANAGKTSNPPNTQINLFIVNPFIPYATLYHSCIYRTSEKIRIIRVLRMFS
jgi:hypothetical protein